MNYLRWRWIMLGMVVLELLLILAAIPFYLLFGEGSLLYVVPLSCLFGAIIVGYWIGRKAGRRQVLHGALMGMFAVLFLVLPNLVWGQPEPLAYDIGHVLKILGGMFGGWLSARSSAAKVAGPSP
jgi:putative membrane protein (TIGR04086 family)